MKEIMNDYKGFTKKDWIIYGIVMPLALVAIAILSSYGE